MRAGGDSHGRGKYGRGESTVCLMAKQLGMDVFPVDIGVVRPIKSEKVLQFSVRRGTANFAHEPAMTRKEALEAVEIGIKMAEMCAEKGYSLLIGGEMGIGNTTTSAAVTAALTGVEAAAVTGRGAGLSTVGLERKIAVIEAALALHKPDPNDSIDVLHKVGGLDIAGLCGLYLGAAAQRIPVVLDGVISCAAALLAVRLCPQSVHFMVAAHRSDEPASILLLNALGKRPFLTAGMHLGEGTGAAAGVALFGPGTGAISGNGELRGHWNRGISAAKVVVCLTDSTNFYVNIVCNADKCDLLHSLQEYCMQQKAPSVNSVLTVQFLAFQRFIRDICGDFVVELLLLRIVFKR